MSKARLIGPAGMSGLTALRGASSLIKSIQRGTISITDGNATNTATITPVNVDNTELVWLGESATTAADNPGYSWVGVALTNATTVTATRGVSVAAGTATVSYEVIEYAPGVVKSIQRGTTGAITANSYDATITAVDMAKSRVLLMGHVHGSFTFRGDYSETRAQLTAATTVNFATALGTASAIPAPGISFQVTEFF